MVFSQILGIMADQNRNKIENGMETGDMHLPNFRGTLLGWGVPTTSIVVYWGVY